MNSVKKLAKESIQKARSYYPLVEYSMREKAFGEVAEDYWDQVAAWNNVVSDLGLKSEIDKDALSIILCEMHENAGHYKSKTKRVNKINPFFEEGVEEMLSALDLYGEEPYNLESVIFRFKESHKVTDERKKDEHIEALRRKDATPRDYVINGIEVQRVIMELLSTKRLDFEILMQKVKDNNERVPEKMRSERSEVLPRRACLKTLYQYFRDHVSDKKEMSDREIYVCIGCFVDIMGLMPETNADKTNPKEYREFLIRNVKQDLRRVVQKG